MTNNLRQTTSFALTDELRRVVTNISDEYSETDLTTTLEKSHSILVTLFGDGVENHFVMNSGDTEISLPLFPILEVQRVKKNNIDTQDFTVEDRRGIVTLTGNIEDKDRIKIKYVPSIFRDIELLLAKRQFILEHNIVASSSESEANIENINFELNNMIKRVRNNVQRLYGVPSLFPVKSQ